MYVGTTGATLCHPLRHHADTYSQFGFRFHCAYSLFYQSLDPGASTVVHHGHGDHQPGNPPRHTDNTKHLREQSDETALDGRGSGNYVSVTDRLERKT